MAKYLCLQRRIPTESSAHASKSPSQARMQELYAQFGAWQETFAAQLVDLGGRLGSGRVVTEGPIDGPFVEIKELAGGYMIVEANSLDEAIEVARGCPGLVRAGSGVEVIEIFVPE